MSLNFFHILRLLFGLAVYLASGEKSKNKPYGSWPNVLGPQFRGSALDVRENLVKEMGEGKRKKGKGGHWNSKKKKRNLASHQT